MRSAERTIKPNCESGTALHITIKATVFLITLINPDAKGNFTQNVGTWFLVLFQRPTSNYIVTRQTGYPIEQIGRLDLYWCHIVQIGTGVGGGESRIGSL